MEEKLTIVNPDEELNSATPCCEGEEISVCNCEGEETVTVFESDEDVIDWEEDPRPETKKELLTRKCREVKDACQSTAKRLARDWQETAGNPYIKQTCITQVDIYRSPDDEEPIDTFRTEHVKSYSARSLAVLGAAAFVIAGTVPLSSCDRICTISDLPRKKHRKESTMIDLLELHKYFILNHLKEGDVAVDFTMGNGYDTEFLCRTVGERGHVYAFDIQAQAVESTAKRLREVGCPENYTLIHDSHHNVKNYVQTPIKAGMFNLGWLPGGDKSITTLRETTMPAIEAAIDLLDRDAILNVAVYPGHAEGDAEGKMICDYLASISRHKVCATRVNILNSPTSPYFIIIETKP